MKPSDSAQIGHLLSEIRDLYGTLWAMTKRFLNDFSLSALQDLLRERALVLLKIDSEKERLLRISELKILKQYDTYGEITSHIAAIVSCDREIASRVTLGMDAIKRELSLLSYSSNAAISYTRHCRR